MTHQHHSNIPSAPASVRRGRRAIAATLVAAVLAGACTSNRNNDAAGSTAPTSPSSTLADSASPAVATIETDLTFAVDPALANPAFPDQGQLVFADGATETVIVDQLSVVAPTQAAFDAFAQRWPLTIVELDTPSPDGEIAGLFALAADAAVDTTTLATDFEQLQPWLGGATMASDPRLLQLYAVVASEALRGELIVVPNDVVMADGEGPWGPIQDGRSTESLIEPSQQRVIDEGTNPFEWTYLADGTTQDFGVVGAWTILEGTNSFKRTANIMVEDGGFVSTFDYGPNSKLFHGDWGNENGMGCGGGNPCPWHGTGVAQTAVAHMDDWTGVVGTAAPIGRLLAINAPSPSSWKNMRNLRDRALEQGADVVNMSWGSESTSVPGAREDYYDYYFKRIYNSNVLLVAAAGNDGRNVDAGACGNGCDEVRLIMPCESKYVLCVGGVGYDSIARDAGSNFGTVDDNKSVEIYGPFRVMVSSIDDSGAHPEIGANVFTSGTSFSSPFVAGIGALLFGADFDMTPSRATSLLKDNARSVVSDIDIRVGSRRLVNARQAVLDLLDLELQKPTVTFATPTDGEEITPDGLVAIRPEAHDMFGNPLWTALYTGSGDIQYIQPGGSTAATLPVGESQLAASTNDRFGQYAETNITVTVPEVKATLEIVGVAEGETVDGGTRLDLIGRGRDGILFQPIPTDGLAWALLDPSGELIAINEGETARFDVPNEAGTYTVVLDSNDVTADEVTVSFEVREIDPNFTPVIQIASPVNDDWFAVNGLYEADIDFSGRAFVDGNPVPGERLRWVATASNGEVVVLCQGTSFTAKPGDIVSSVTRCSEGTGTLHTVPTGGENTWWKVALEVIDPSTGSIASDSVVIYLEYIAS